MAPVITRFAPAPSGYLHLGHLLNAVYVWDIARARGPDARVLLRIEDHDRARSRPAFEAALLEDLAWLGFAADGELTRQSERGALYERALGRYPGTCRDKRLRELAGLGIWLRLDPAVERFDDLRLGAA